MPRKRIDLETLERLHQRYHLIDYLRPDPLQWLHEFEAVADREVVGIIAAGLAYGRVNQINRNIEIVLDVLDGEPAQSIAGRRMDRLSRRLRGFKHRWTTREEMVALFRGLRRVRGEWGSLEDCFRQGFEPEQSLLDGLQFLVDQLLNGGPDISLLSAPDKKSACKRMMLFLRWMIREDAIDPGGWTAASPADLIVPLDTHMYRQCRGWLLTRRKSADLKTAQEITRAFARLNPDDPVKYDFAITRMGIRDDAPMVS